MRTKYLGAGVSKCLSALVASALMYSCTSALAVDGGELNRWRDSGQGWWLGSGLFSVSNATEPWTGARGAVSNGATLASTNGVYAMRFNGSSTFIDIPSQPRFNFSSASDPTTVICTGPPPNGMQGMCSDGQVIYWSSGSIVYVFTASGQAVTNWSISAGHCNDAAWWAANDNPIGTNVILWCGGSVAGPTNGTLYAYMTNGVAAGTWDLGHGSSLTNIGAVAHTVSNQFGIISQSVGGYVDSIASVYLGANGACSVAWTNSLPTILGLYPQGSAGTNGHMYALYDLDSVDKVYTAAIYDFGIGTNGYTYNGLMLCAVPTQTENDGMTWFQSTLIIGGNQTVNSYSGTVRRTSWPMVVKHGFTLSAWATKESNSGNLNLVTKFYGNTGGRSWIMDNINGQLGCYLRDTNDSSYIFQGGYGSGVGGGTNFPLYTWHNYTISFDGMNLIAYTDGYVAYASPTPINAATGLALASPTDVLIGSIVGSQYWMGFMKDVRVWNRPLSAAEVKRLYLEGP
ncbi:MAG TPA: LamG-like jellyroll fold domain-containing protein [Verrucomicrobiae bacterium]|nr:LamG-like jellyroll fold domain-containing protein [Verrucomicrobiae bacterium]